MRQVEIPDWTGVNIENEAGATNQRGKSIHDFLNGFIGSSPDIVFYDHGTGEIADYLVLKLDSTELKIQLYHCKGSGGANPGNRVGDVYEVVGQAQKSLKWCNIQKLLKKVDMRKNATKFKIGSYEKFKSIIEQAKNLKKSFEIIIVQPGISVASANDNITENLGATNNIIINSGNTFKVLASS